MHPAQRTLSRTERLRQIEQLLYRTAGGLSAAEIARCVGVDRRTVYRDLDLLDGSAVPLWQEGGKFGILRERYLTPVRLSLHEAMALLIAARLLARYADEYNPHVVSALDKLATALPESVADYVAQTAEALRRRPVDDAAVAVLEQVTLAWAERRVVRLWYRSPRSGEVHVREVAPYFIEVSGLAYSCYLIGYDRSAEGLRTFKLDRLERAQVLDERYTIPPHFDASAYLRDTWGIMHGGRPVEVVLQFSPAVAALVKERVWHPSQSLDELPDGGVLFVARVGDPREMQPWIRSWGADVEVLEPPDLRAEMVEQVQRMAACYRLEGRLRDSRA